MRSIVPRRADERTWSRQGFALTSRAHITSSVRAVRVAQQQSTAVRVERKPYRGHGKGTHDPLPEGEATFKLRPSAIVVWMWAWNRGIGGVFQPRRLSEFIR